jgi:molybdopterin-guanine dinucleotide biosynthesis protein A
MRRSGYVLAGGASSRMGRDKALLAYRETTLIEHVARAVIDAVGSVVIIGDPDRYGKLGHTVCGDRVSGCGPLGGIFTALSTTENDWNLVVACDMPGISTSALEGLIDPEPESGRNAVMAIGPGGEPEPLCAVYHRCCLAAVDRAIREKRFKMKDLVKELEAEFRPMEAAVLANVNTPSEWAEFEEDAR